MNTSKTNKTSDLPTEQELLNKEVAASLIWRISNVWHNRSKERIEVGAGLPLLGFIARTYAKDSIGRKAQELSNAIIFRNIGDVPEETPRVIPLKNS